MEKKIIRHLTIFFAAMSTFVIIYYGFASPLADSPMNFLKYSRNASNDTIAEKDSLHYPIEFQELNPFIAKRSHSLDLNTPNIFKSTLSLDSSLSNYTYRNSINGLQIGEPTHYSIREYLDESNKQFQRNYFKERAKSQNFLQGEKSFSPKLSFKAPEAMQDFIGDGGIEIKPQGSAELIFSLDVNKVENPAWSIKQQRTTQFKFDQKIKLSVRGNIGDKIGLGIGYDTESNFDFDNEIKLRYEGKEDEIVKLLEAGNVSLPVQGSLITGSQSLFGVKGKFQFGKMTMTTVFSQQKSEKKEIVLENGAQKTTYSISSLDYEDNRHFFLNHYFRDFVYEQAYIRPPIMNSPVQVTRMEVWIVNKSGDTRNTRNVIGFMDLGEPAPWNNDNENPNKGNFVVKKGDYPDNNANTLYDQLDAENPLSPFRSNSEASQKLAELNQAPTNFFNGQDYFKIDNARMLSPNEYTINEKLGFISINQWLDPNTALAVSYEYTFNGVRYQVGEFAQDIPPDPNKPNVLFLKLLKSTSARTDIPMWDLMMKNIYYLGSSQIQANDFKLDLIYEDDKSGANLNYIPEDKEPKLDGRFLTQVLGLDRLNQQLEEESDGIFDFVNGYTIYQGSGKIIFPNLEPFGNALRKQFKDSTLANFYAFDALYDSTPVQAEQLKQYDKFYIRGSYLGTSGSEISLNAINIPEGSVQVSAGGVQLRENVDYQVDYTLGRVKITNQSVLNSGQPIKITAESNTLFSIQQKTLLGTRLDYRFDEDFILGGTLLYLKEKPLTQKVNIGDEPLNNVIYGFDGTYRTDSRFITKLIDKIPFIETKEKSEILITGEFAHLIPGHPKIIGPTGTSYIDDFEGSEVPFDLRMGNNWVLASTPQGQNSLFPNGNFTNDLQYGFNRAKISWYSIDDLFYRNNTYTPKHIAADLDMLSKHRMREVSELEVFPNKQLPQGIPGKLSTFDLYYSPTTRGPYNYDVAHFNDNGSLMNPAGNWGGIMRALQTNDFEAANIEYLEFWLMDPYADEDFQPDDGKLIIHLGDISEDILKDGQKMFENGLPKDGDLTKTNNTVWGKVPLTTPINYAFDNDRDSRAFQDLGFDGLNDEEERVKFKDVLDNLPSTMTVAARDKIYSDPANDNYLFYRNDSLDRIEADIIARYYNYKNTEGNSPVTDPNQVFSTSGSLSPDVEDINFDFTLNEVEAYYQYVIDIRENMQVGENHIVDKQVRNVKLVNGSNDNVIWYQIKIPVRSYDNRIGQIRDFKSIRFIRLAFTDFEKDIVCRFGRLQLVRGDWRRYLYDLSTPGEYIGGDEQDTSTFNISTVNIEANGKRDPIPYVLPPGIDREVDVSTYELLEQNEQSLSFSTCLEDGDAKAAYKTTSFDVRTYKRLKMFVHAEGKTGQTLEAGDLSLFIRLGTDFNNNFYEYEIPLDPSELTAREADDIWKTNNEIDLAFEEFFSVKQMRETTPGASLADAFTRWDIENKGKITVVGNPDLSNVKVVMIGVRNPSKDDPYNDNDLGEAHCGVIWINELRVSDFDETGGWAAVGKITTKLADFGKVNLSGNITTVGFGGLEQKLQDRSKEDIRAFDIQSYLELGKFFPQKANVKIPMFYNYSQSRSKPQYNPLSPDILLQTRLDLAKTRQETDSILNATETYITRTSLNFMNVQKLRQGGAKKSRIYDIENFLLTYAYNDIFKRDINTEYDYLENHQFILNYNYNFKEKNITPFKKLSKSKHLKLITDFNLGLLPQSFMFKAQMDRRFGEVLYRSTENVQTILKPIYQKNFVMNRTYDYKHNLARALRFSYNASADAVVDEPDGPRTDESRDTLLMNLKTLGRMKNFNQKISLSYDVPLRKIPILNWTSIRSSYTGSYNWQEAPPSAPELGNMIQNSQTIQLQGQLNFVSFYGKIKFLKNINSNRSNIAEIKKNKLKDLQKNAKENGEDLLNDDGDKMTAEDVPVNEGFIKMSETVLRTLMSLRNVTANYTLNEGTTLPGFEPNPQYIGNDWNLNAPGLAFLAGIQEDDFRFKAAQNGWLSMDTTASTLFMATKTENLSIQANIEPVRDFKINVTFTRRLSNNMQSVFKYDPDSESFEDQSKVNGGNFSMSFWSLGTSLSKYTENVSSAYTSFENNRNVVAHRIVDNSTVAIDTNNYPAGRTGTAQDVIIPAFLAAYAGKNALTYTLSAFPAIPAPNWRITYNGLSKIEAFKKFAKNININHAYRSTYSVGSFVSSLDFKEDEVPVLYKNLVPELRIQQININEQLSPLIGLDINWINNWTSRVEYRTSRNIGFSFSNFTTTEISDRDLTIGIGYRAKEVELPSFIKHNGKRVILEHDLNFRLDFTYKNSRSTISRLDQEQTESIGGNSVLTIKPVLDYVIDDNLTIRFFFNRNVTKPAISTSYPTAFTNGGFSIRYTLGQ
ncbi:MAG: cell surface protein SprA [Bacteroidetes bacterium]|nr:cell surface protein SprA [Bacteroidota bacterium]MBT5992689.1 cell surface protein SprA [Bacteroidota bacterium]